MPASARWSRSAWGLHYALLDGLGGGAAGQNGLITVFGLVDHASHMVQQLTADQQRPYIAMIGEDLALAAHPDRLAQVTPPAGEHAPGMRNPPRNAGAWRLATSSTSTDPNYQWMHRALSEDVLTAFTQLHQLDVYDENMLRFVTRDAPDVIDATQRAGINMLVQGAWVQDKQLNVSVQVQSVARCEIITSERARGPVDQFAQLTGQLVTGLFDQLPIDVPNPLAARLRRPA